MVNASGQSGYKVVQYRTSGESSTKIFGSFLVMEGVRWYSTAAIFPNVVSCACTLAKCLLFFQPN